MAWTYLVAGEDSVSPYEIGSSHEPFVKSTDTLPPSYSLECQRVNCRSPRSGTTSEHSRRKTCRSIRRLSTGDSRARISALRDAERVWKESTVDYFSKLPVSLGRFDLPSFSWKTVQQSLFGEPLKFSMRLVRCGMTVGGWLYALPRSVRPTSCVKDGFSWPMITAQDAKNNGGPSQGRRHTMPLNLAVRLYPTLRAHEHGQYQRDHGQKGKERPTLTGVLKQWPTLKASPSGPDYARRNRQGSGGDDLITTVGGSLNPTWAEWFMGYPLGWTELESWATRWFRSKRERRSNDCCRSGEARGCGGAAPALIQSDGNKF